MDYALSETARRREKQIEFNLKHGIKPKTIKKEIPDLLKEFVDVNEELKTYSELEVIENAAVTIEKLRKKMLKEAEALNFEEAAKIRDQIKRLEERELTL